MISLRSLSVRLVFGSALAALAVPIEAQTTTCASLGYAGGTAQGQRAAVSDDGRYVAFENLGGQIVPGDTNGNWDIFLFDRVTGTTELVSLSSTGQLSDAHSQWPSVSADGRYVCFSNSSKTLVPGDTGFYSDIFLRDRVAATTTLVSVSTTGGFPTGGNSSRPFMTGDARFVVFESYAGTLVTGEVGAWDDVFLRDRVAGTTQRCSMTASGTQGNGDSYMPHVSANGRWVVFTSKATNFEAGVNNGKTHIWRKDLLTGALDRVSVAVDGGQANDNCFLPHVSDDGRYVSFESWAGNLVAGDTGGLSDIFVRDMQLGQTQRISVSPAFVQGDYSSSNNWISGDGRFVTFASVADNLVPDTTILVNDVFVRDMATGTTTLQSVSTAGVQGDLDSGGTTPYNGGLMLSHDGKWLAFDSAASNFVPGDGTYSWDVFLRGPLPAGPAAFAPDGAPLAGTNGKPLLVGTGTLAAGGPVSLQTSNARASAPCWFLTGLSAIHAPFKGGVMVPNPDLYLPLVTDPAGTLLLATTWPAGLPSGLPLWWQTWVSDPAGPSGFASTNGLKGVTP